MSIMSLVEASFLAQSKIYFQQEDNFDAHADYLRNSILRKYRSEYDINKFNAAIDVARTDIDAGVTQLFYAVQGALRKMLDEQIQKGQELVGSYQNGKLVLQDQGNRQTRVQSERGNNILYHVDLHDYTCDCKWYKRIKYAGMWCKHLVAAHEVFKSRYPLMRSIPAEGQQPAPQMVETHDEPLILTFGSQKLTQRVKTGNPLIPSGHTYLLPNEAEMVFYALQHNEPLLLIGDSGVGKSMMIYYLAEKTNTPLMAPSAHVEMTVENLLGSMTVVNGNTVWKNGVIPEAMRRGYWLLIDELNSIDPGVLKVLNELLDTKKLTITVAGEPRIVKAHNDFRLICTMNPPDNPIYKGIESFSFEFMDRFDTVVHLDYLKPDLEVVMIMDKSRYCDEGIVIKMVTFANHVREGMQKGELFTTVTTRSLLSWAKKAKVFPLETAAQVTIFGKMSQIDKQKALDLYHAIFK